jgi:hypothetical protein
LLSTHNMLAPLSSFPLLPALPAIYKYSVDDKISYFSPLNFIDYVNITDLAGILSPIAKVDVAKTTLSKLSWNRISTISFKRGIIPA